MKYRYTLTHSIEFQHPLLHLERGVIRLIDQDGKLRGVLDTDDATLTIRAGYSWNGCSPKVRVAGLTLGTPDGPVKPAAWLADRLGTDWQQDLPQTCPASLVHDCLYQWLDPLHLERWRADSVFHCLLHWLDWPAAGLYATAVDLFGGVAHSISRNPKVKIFII